MKNSEADLYDAPTVVEWVDNNFIHLSIFDGNYMNFPVRSRCILSYHKSNGHLECRCNLNRFFCVHRAIALWYQTNQITQHTQYDETLVNQSSEDEFEDKFPAARANAKRTTMIYPPESNNDSMLKGQVTRFWARKLILFNPV